MLGLLKLGVMLLASGLLQPRNEYPGLGVAVIDELRVEVPGSQARRLGSSKTNPLPGGETEIFRSCKSTWIGAKLAKTE